MKEKNTYSEKILIGAVAMIILLFLMAPAFFYDWLSYEFLSKAVTIFFVIPIAFAIVKFKAPKEILVVVGVGGILYVLYAVLLALTFKESFEIILQTVVEIVFITVVIELTKRWMEEGLPP